jgi:hypothetical protein
MDRRDLWLHFFRSALAGVSGDIHLATATIHLAAQPRAEFAAQIADAALEAYAKRWGDEAPMKELKGLKEQSR